MANSTGSAANTLTVSAADIPAAPVITSVSNTSPAGTASAVVTVPVLNAAGGGLTTPVSKISLFWSLTALPTDPRLLFGADPRTISTTSKVVVGTPANVTITTIDGLTALAAYFFVAVASN